MDNELNDSLSDNSPQKSYSEIFHEVFPYYLSIGMSREDFWDNDVELARDYRKAEELRLEHQNTMLWYQGMYIYEALCDVAPILQAFAKRGTKPQKYSDKPYPITPRMQEQYEKEKEQKSAMAWMNALETIKNKTRKGR